jgi:hypothetical protein
MLEFIWRNFAKSFEAGDLGILTTDVNSALTLFVTVTVKGVFAECIDVLCEPVQERTAKRK